MGGAVLFVAGMVGLLLLISLIFQIAFGLLIPIIFWMLAGMLAGRAIRGRGYGPLNDVLLGLVGGVVGGLVLGMIGLGGIGEIWLVGNIIAGVLGAVLIVYGVRFFGNKQFGA